MPNAQASLRLTFKSILVPVDFTDASVTALAYARAIAKGYGAKTCIAHALNPTPPVFIPMEPIQVEMDVEWQDAQTEFKRFLRKNSTNGESAEGILARGVTWNVIQDVVSERSIDLIVLGSHGKQCRASKSRWNWFQAHFVRDRFLRGIFACSSLRTFPFRRKSGEPLAIARDPDGTGATSETNRRDCP